MKIALIGYGKMGKTIESIAEPLGFEIVARIHSKSKEAEWEKITKADACIDFTHPHAILTQLQKAACYRKPIVIGTTGWYEEMDTVKKIADENQIGMIYAQNFSLGMNLFMQIVKEAAKLINHADGYDVALSEIHHREKADSPSGTALAIADLLIRNIERKNEIKSHLGDEKIKSSELHVSSTRVGAVPGTHTVTFNSSQDTITLTHQAHERTMWAEGALEAARWVQHRKGFFNIQEMLGGATCNSQD